MKNKTHDKKYRTECKPPISCFKPSWKTTQPPVASSSGVEIASVQDMMSAASFVDVKIGKEKQFVLQTDTSL